jgi:hypothetical protein
MKRNGWSASGFSGHLTSSSLFIAGNFMIYSMTKWSRAGIAAVLLFFAGGAGLTAQSVSAAEPAKTAPCSAPPFQQFDFWVGDWDAFDVGKPTIPVARTRVTRILDGCVLLEVYEGANGHIGQSFSIYDASRKVWHQSWVTNRGELLIIEGGIRAGDMVLSGADRTKDGKTRKVRGTWKPVEGGVSEAAVSSTDGGKSWKPWFDLVFRPHRP